MGLELCGEWPRRRTMWPRHRGLACRIWAAFPRTRASPLMRPGACPPAPGSRIGRRATRCCSGKSGRCIPWSLGQPLRGGRRQRARTPPRPRPPRGRRHREEQCRVQPAPAAGRAPPRAPHLRARMAAQPLSLRLRAAARGCRRGLRRSAASRARLRPGASLPFRAARRGPRCAAARPAARRTAPRPSALSKDCRRRQLRGCRGMLLDLAVGRLRREKTWHSGCWSARPSSRPSRSTTAASALGRRLWCLTPWAPWRPCRCRKRRFWRSC
mmetsp:Transcript_151988/g.487946  ORF Transcript_151988/g.487946 Transcript_151988/m.487946 type:complete len:270 (+) Transcript_151988:92-901(+)